MHQNLAIELNESNDLLQTKWKGFKDCYKKYQKAEKLIGDESGNCTMYHRWCWAEPLQFLESCQWNKASKFKISETSNLVSSVESVLLPTSPPVSPLAVSTTSIPAQCVEIKEVAIPPVEAMREVPKPKPRPLTFIRTTAAGESACFLDPSCKRKWKRNYSTSADSDRALSKRARRPGPVDLLFKSYIETFKALSSKKQAALKIKLAKLFAGAEMDESEVFTESASSETDDQVSILDSDVDLIIKH